MAEALARAARHGPFRRAPVVLAPAGPVTRFNFRGAADAARLCGEAFGCPLTTEACRSTQKAARAALWLGPDEWLLLDFEGVEPAGLAASIAAALGAVPHSLVDISHRQGGLDVSGERAAEVLNAGCPLDLGLEACPLGMATRTVFGKADVTLWRRGEHRFHLEANRSFLPYVVSFLQHADDGAA